MSNNDIYEVKDEDVVAYIGFACPGILALSPDRFEIIKNTLQEAVCNGELRPEDFEGMREMVKKLGMHHE